MTFSFVVDALKGRIKGTNHDTLAAIQIIPSTGDGKESDRDTTDSAEDASKN